MLTGPIYFGTFLYLWAHTITNIQINVHRSHLLWQFFFAACTHYGKYSHQCLQVPSTLAVFLCCGHTLWQISTSMFAGPIYFVSFSLLREHFMAYIHINVYRSHLLLHFFVIVGTRYSKYSHQCSQVPSTWQIFTSMFIGPIYFGSLSLLCTHFMAIILINVHRSHHFRCGHTLWQIFTSIS
jgi:hypothetical protein